MLCCTNLARLSSYPALNTAPCPCTFYNNLATLLPCYLAGTKAERPADADGDRGGLHMHVVGLNTANLMARCQSAAQQTLPMQMYVPDELGQ